jgi:hypothetical protein
MKPPTDNTPQTHWFGMPDFQQTKQRPYAQIILRVENAEQLSELSRRLEQPLTPKTKSAWFPFKSHWGAEKKVWVSDES